MVVVLMCGGGFDSIDVVVIRFAWVYVGLFGVVWMGGRSFGVENFADESFNKGGWFCLCQKVGLYVVFMRRKVFVGGDFF